MGMLTGWCVPARNQSREERVDPMSGPPVLFVYGTPDASQEKFRKWFDFRPPACYTVGMELPHVASELLEPHITKLMGILFHEYARTGCTKTGFKILSNQAKALSMLISSLKATHCNIAFTNQVQGMLWEMERDPKFMKTINRHFMKVYRGS